VPAPDLSRVLRRHPRPRPARRDGHRDDVAILAIDTSKDERTLGPLREGLARLDTDHKAAVRVLRAVHARIPKRTKWLSQQRGITTTR
jgi:hypothetical protein